jgi:hypothetical protein
MNDGALKAVYGDIRPYLYFRVATFTPDGNFIQFITLDGYHGGPETSWKYDLRTGSLESGPVIPDDESDTQTVGEYSVTVGPSCRGCGGSIVARNLKTGREFEITSSTDSGFVGSSDGKVIFWSDGRMMVSALGTRQTTHITLPSSPGFEPLAARPEGDGYLLAYDVAGPCNFDGPALVQQIESDQAEKVAQKDPNASARQPHNLCFLHVSVPAR